MTNMMRRLLLAPVAGRSGLGVNVGRTIVSGGAGRGIFLGLAILGSARDDLRAHFFRRHLRKPLLRRGWPR